MIWALVIVIGLAGQPPTIIRMENEESCRKAEAITILEVGKVFQVYRVFCIQVKE